MAFTDHTTGRNQRATVMLTVAVLQGAAIIALVNGLAVDFIVNPPDPPLAGEQIRLDPPPIPPKPPKMPEMPKQPETQIERPDTLIDFPDSIGFNPPVEFPPGGLDFTRNVDPPVPPSMPKFTPQLARPSNDRANWATTGDYPPRDLREGNQGVTGFRLVVGANGKVESCIVTKSSGFAGLDAATCKHVSYRARFVPATDGNGQKVTGEYTSSVRWVIPE